MTFNRWINCLKVSTLSLFLLFFQTAQAQANFQPATAYIDAHQKELGATGALLIASPDTLLYSRPWGGTTLKTVVPIGAASSLLTAALILQLAGEGKLSLDDKVAKYLPVFKSYGKNFITLRHCLTHQTGIADEGKKLTRMLDKKNFTSLDDLVASYAAREIETNPGTAFSYNEMGPAIAGRVAEVVTKKRFDLLIKQKLLTPAGMRQTTFTTLDGSAQNPSNGARATLADLMAFLRMVLNNGVRNGAAIVSPGTIAQLRAVQTAAVRAVPKLPTGFTYTFGGWAADALNGNATALAAPNFAGLWPVVDFCRGNAIILLTDTKNDDGNAATYGDLKKLVDTQFKTTCN